MKWFRRFLIIPSIAALLLIETLYLAGLVLWLFGWPYAERIQSSNDFDGLWDDNGPAIFYYVTLTVVVLITMVLLPFTLIPFWKGYIARWAVALILPYTLFTIALLTNSLYATVRFITLDCDDYENVNLPGVDLERFCYGSKVIFSASVVLIFTAGICAGYLVWLLQESIFQAARKVHKRGKSRDAKLETVRRGPIERETVTGTV